MPASRKQEAFKLFSQGFSYNDNEVKALGLTYDSRKGYYYEWLKGVKPGKINAVPKGEGLAVKVITDHQAGGEVVSEEAPGVVSEEESPPPPPPPPPPAKTEPQRTQLIPAFGEAEQEAFKGLKVAGSTLPFRVDISVKTLSLYEIAATEAAVKGEALDMGKFIDTCAEDYFTGRGFDLGLIILKPEKGKEKEGGDDGR